MRRKKVVYNAVAGLSLQLVMIIYGFVFPRLVMSVYGSSVNGLLQSISQFLSYITLLDAGVSAVIRAKLYKPLANQDKNKTQKIVNSARKFYKKIAISFMIYMFVVAIILPITYSTYFDKLYTFSLVIIIGISTFAEYYFGISYIVLLEADQRKYISYCIQIISVILNIIASVLLINGGLSIHIVKLCTAVLFVSKPIILSQYCARKYGFSKQFKEQEPIDNKWSGLGHHIAYFLHSHTDIVILTFVKGPILVSVYSVYYMIVSALQQIIFYISGGVEAAFGNMIAKKEDESLSRGLCIYELLIFSLSSVFFSTAAVSIFQFVKIYTQGITDVDYIIPVAGIVLIIAEFIYCVRKPYEAVVMAAGKLKETMRGAFIEAGINILLSVILVWRFGILGVVSATLAAMLFRTIQYVVYVSKNIVKRSIGVFFKHVLVFGISSLIIYFLGKNICLESNTYFSWAIWASLIFLLSCVFIVIVDSVFYHNEFIDILKMFFSIFKKNESKG